jgi:hypothetical protein
VALVALGTTQLNTSRSTDLQTPPKLSQAPPGGITSGLPLQAASVRLVLAFMTIAGASVLHRSGSGVREY